MATDVVPFSTAVSTSSTESAKNGVSSQPTKGRSPNWCHTRIQLRQYIAKRLNHSSRDNLTFLLGMQNDNPFEFPSMSNQRPPDLGSPPPNFSGTRLHGCSYQGKRHDEFVCDDRKLRALCVRTVVSEATICTTPYLLLLRTVTWKKCFGM